MKIRNANKRRSDGANARVENHEPDVWVMLAAGYPNYKSAVVREINGVWCTLYNTSNMLKEPIPAGTKELAIEHAIDYVLG